MYANNEIGTIHPMRKIGEIAKEKGIISIATRRRSGQRSRSMSIRHIDLMSMSAHKITVPRASRTLCTLEGPRVRLTAQMDGGGHERGMRSGTLT